MHITKGMQRRLNIEWEGDRMGQAEETDYLGTIISANGNNETKINKKSAKCKPSLLPLKSNNTRENGNQQ